MSLSSGACLTFSVLLPRSLTAPFLEDSEKVLYGVGIKASDEGYELQTHSVASLAGISCYMNLAFNHINILPFEKLRETSNELTFTQDQFSVLSLLKKNFFFNGYIMLTMCQTLF